MGKNNQISRSDFLKLAATGASAAVVANLLAACAPAATSTPTAAPAATKPLEGKVIWYMDVLSSNPILNAWAQAINKPIMEAGGKTIRSYALNQAGQLDMAVMAEAFGRAIAAKPDAIIYFVLDPKAMGPQVAAAREAGIPVFAMAGKPVGFDVNAYMHGQDYKQGYLIAMELAKSLNPGDEVTIISGAVDSDVVGNELKGVLAAFKDAGLKFVGDWDAQRNMTDIASGGQEVMQGLLPKYPNLKGIVPFNDDSALGAIAAIKAAGKEDQILVATRNGSTPGVEAVKKGELLCTLDLDPIGVGILLGQAIVDHLTGKKVLDNNYELLGPDPKDGALWPDGPMVTKANAGIYKPWEERIPYADIEER